MSDQQQQPPPDEPPRLRGTMEAVAEVDDAMEPRFRVVDPQSEAVFTVRLPKTIVKLAETPSATGEPAFEEHDLTQAEEIELEVGWADTPYYQDPRARDRGTIPVASWGQDTLRVRYRPEGSAGQG